MPRMMTTREVAGYLRIKERKVYELVAKRRIPCSRVTGKWLFPGDLIDLWVAAGNEGPAVEGHRPPAIVAGSHDPLLDWALKESACDLAMLACGSAGGLDRLAEGRAAAAGLHLLDTDTGEYNLPAVRRRLAGAPVVVIEWARRRQGIVVAAGNPLGIADGRAGALRDLRDKRARVIERQEGAGSRVLFGALLAEAGIDRNEIERLPETAKDELDLGLAVLDGKADAGLAIEAVARQLRLGFIGLAEERYDLVVRRRDYFEPPFQALLAFARGPALGRRAKELGGYDIGGLGRVLYNAP